MNDNGTINDNGGEYAGLDRYEARKQIVEELKRLGLLVKIEDHSHNVGTHDRCKTTVEPMVKQQWFVTVSYTHLDVYKRQVREVAEREVFPR